MTFAPPRFVQVLVIPNHPQNYELRDNGMMWVRGDYELLGKPFERDRKEISGQPQTVNMATVNYGLVPASADYKRITKGLNPGMTDAMLIDMMDKWTPDNAKWRDGEEKVPCEIIFANNIVGVIGPIQNPGGLTGIPSGAMVYQIDTLDYDSLKSYNAENVPSRYIMHFTNNLNGANVVNPDITMGGRNGIPVRLLITSKSKMYLRQELLDEIGTRTNRYSPPWSFGVF